MKNKKLESKERRLWSESRRNDYVRRMEDEAQTKSKDSERRKRKLLKRF